MTQRMTIYAITARHANFEQAAQDCCALLFAPDVYDITMYSLKHGEGLPTRPLQGLPHWFIVAHQRRWEVN